MFKDKKILLAVTGSIAAYKAVLLLRLLVKAGAEVKVIMTPDAGHFVSPLTFSTLSKNVVEVELINHDSWSNHVMLGRWAEIMVIAPATCNSLAKMATGLCDNLLQAVYLSATCPVMVVPAMDEDMWKHPATQANITKLKEYGNIILDVGVGELASGLEGQGRMEEPEAIFLELEMFFSKKCVLKDKQALVTAGPTFEAIDPVRFIGNHSTGKMGIAIAAELAARGAAVTLVLGPTEIQPPVEVNTIRVTTAQEMYNAVMEDFDRVDMLIMAAAVADYRPELVHPEKIKKSAQLPELKLVETDDILREAGKRKSGHQLLTGFALETNNEKANARKKLLEKNADFIVLNSLNHKGAGFGTDTNKISIFDKKGNEHEFPLKSKKEVAADIVNVITQNIHE